MTKDSTTTRRAALARARLRRSFAATWLVLAAAGAAAADSGPAPLPMPLDHSAAPITRKRSIVPSEKQIDINRAGREQLKTLPGIGDAEAARIIAGRPYVSKADLVERKVLPEGLYISIRYRIIAIPIDGRKSTK